MKLVAWKLIFKQNQRENQTMFRKKPAPYEQIPPNNGDDAHSDTTSIKTKPGWDSVSLGTASSIGTHFGWQGSSITSEQITILGESIRYRLMALALELPNRLSKKTSNQSNFEPLEESLEAVSTNFEYESSEKTLEEKISTDTEAKSLKTSIELIVNKIIEWGQTWPKCYENVSLSNIIKNINDWFKSFSTSGMQNSTAVIIKSLIYDCLNVFQDTHKINYSLNNLINYADANTKFMNPHQVIISQIKKGAKFEDICFDDITFEDKTQLFNLYFHVFQRLHNVQELVREFINYYPQAEINDNKETQFTCSPCCCIQ
ncbi:MAG: hypothetical protein AMJ43_05230 [Coxiella sp. DG_40]|nr:MAG: hypothetical protein AMJ43_05230 [Coxiella sp. DG_40]